MSRAARVAVLVALPPLTAYALIAGAILASSLAYRQR